MAVLMAVASRSPYGERGLKYSWTCGDCPDAESLSLRRAWIEILQDAQAPVVSDVALLTESVD